MYVDPNGESFWLIVIAFMIAAVIVCTVATSPGLLSSFADNTSVYSTAGSSMSGSFGLGGSIFDDGLFVGTNMAGGTYSKKEGYQTIVASNQTNVLLFTRTKTRYDDGTTTTQTGFSILGFSFLWDQNSAFSLHLSLEATGGMVNPSDGMFYAGSAGIDIDITSALRDYFAKR
jgi:hypothetical protein